MTKNLQMGDTLFICVFVFIKHTWMFVCVYIYTHINIHAYFDSYLSEFVLVYDIIGVGATYL